MFSPSVSTLSHHFGRSRWRTLAYGCQAAGSAVGGIVFPVALRYLFPAVGFAWAVRTSGSSPSFFALDQAVRDMGLWLTCGGD